MADRQRIRPRKTAREMLWDSRATFASCLLDPGETPDEGLYADVNDLVADSQEDVRRGDARPPWLDELERFAEELERKYLIRLETEPFAVALASLDSTLDENDRLLGIDTVERPMLSVIPGGRDA